VVVQRNGEMVDREGMTVASGSTAQMFLHYLNEKDRFCDHLELTADLLPDRVDAQDCLLLSQNLVPLVRRAHAFEESQVFPLLLALTPPPHGLPETVDRLCFEHLVDEEFAKDLSLSLRHMVTDRPNTNIDSLAWMLRGFFEGLRRHVAFEREHVLPLLQQLNT
jgi:Hemerythrin HHE cation binding domain